MYNISFEKARSSKFSFGSSFGELGRAKNYEKSSGSRYAPALGNEKYWLFYPEYSRGYNIFQLHARHYFIIIIKVPTL